MENHVVLQEEVISRFHAEIRFENQKYVLYDLESTSGTYVNSRRINRCVLNSGDLISLANIQLMFVDNTPVSDRSNLVTRSLVAGTGENLADGQHTIVVIDDEAGLLIGLQALLRKKGYAVITASNGTDGLDAISRHKPDLILSDVMMPPPDGFEIKKRLSTDPALSKIPFIFLTARTSNEDRISGIRLGADDYIVKPFEPDELIARVEAVFRRIETERTHAREEERISAQQEMDRLRQEILQNIQHELRTPLTNVMMPLEIALMKKYDDPEEQIKFVRMASSNLGRLESLITDLILLTDLDHGKVNTMRQPVHVDNDIIKPIRKRLERYHDKNIRLVLDVEGTQRMMAPRREFAHAVLHLADNAFKFGPQDGEVKITVRKSGGDGIQVDVEDQGEGIPPGLREKVFERFYQISQGDSRSYEGLGVGLTLARALAEGNGGSVQILDAPQGCHVRLTIPATRLADIENG
jgi:signal transduction histidine kinase